MAEKTNSDIRAWTLIGHWDLVIGIFCYSSRHPFCWYSANSRPQPVSRSAPILNQT